MLRTYTNRLLASPSGRMAAPPGGRRERVLDGHVYRWDGESWVLVPAEAPAPDAPEAEVRAGFTCQRAPELPPRG